MTPTLGLGRMGLGLERVVLDVAYAAADFSVTSGDHRPETIRASLCLLLSALATAFSWPRASSWLRASSRRLLAATSSAFLQSRRLGCRRPLDHVPAHRRLFDHKRVAHIRSRAMLRDYAMTSTRGRVEGRQVNLGQVPMRQHQHIATESSSCSSISDM